MNFTEIAKVMHKQTGKSVSNLIRKYQDNEDLKQYLIKDNNGKIVGLKEEGIEVLRNIGYQKAPKLDTANGLELMELRHKIEMLELKLDNQERFYQMAQRENEKLQHENEQLKAELKHYEGMGFFKRLLSYHK